jgi:hypothetical protein
MSDATLADRFSAVANWTMSATFFAASLMAMLIVCPMDAFAEDEANAKPKVQVMFEDPVWPILKTRCLKCHAHARPVGELLLTTRCNELTRWCVVLVYRRTGLF